MRAPLHVVDGVPHVAGESTGHELAEQPHDDLGPDLQLLEVLLDIHLLSDEMETYPVVVIGWVRFTIRVRDRFFSGRSTVTCGGVLLPKTTC